MYKESYECVTMEIIKFQSEDVITTSPTEWTPDEYEADMA